MIVNWIKKNKAESILLLVLFCVSFFLRFSQLGYSHFYGDETKTFYLDKTIPASKFFFDQRKGPIQFLAVWGVEKIIGGFSEFYTRLPFAIAGFLSVFALYLIVRKLFDYKSAFVTSFMYSICGFYVAFSRTIQYQSFLLLFGFLAILFALFTESAKYKKLFLVGSSLFMSFALLSHYDAIFFIIPVLFILIKGISTKKLSLREFILWFVLPIVLVVGGFYLPYSMKGYFKDNTFGYMRRRTLASNFDQNYSPYTIFVYSPFVLGFIPLTFAIFAFFGDVNWKKSMLILWFLVPFILFQFVILNPGTHIHNYLVPLFVLAGVELLEIFKRSPKVIRGVLLFCVGLVLGLNLLSSAFIYVPAVNLGYPWRGAHAEFFKFPPIDKEKHLFLYGFPYYRGWDKVRDYLYAQEGVRSVYTNDNATIAEYYLGKYDINPFGSNYAPQYYVYVVDNQELNRDYLDFLVKYQLEKEISPTTVIYKLK